MFRFFLALVLLSLLYPSQISAHAFGQVYNLPVPVSYYLYGAVGVLALSFLVSAVFLKGKSLKEESRRLDVTNNLIIRALTSDFTKFILKLWSFTLFVFVILAGFIGNQEPTSNLATIHVWVIQLLGVTYLVSIFGNFWSVINPWKNIIEAIELVRGKSFAPISEYPNSLGYIPAIIFYFFFVWLELLSNGLAQSPKFLSELVLFYSLITLSGCLLFGTDTWLKFGEFWSNLYKLLAKASIFQIENNKIYLKFPFFGLLQTKRINFGILLFILLILSSTAFDGFRATIEYLKLLGVFINILGPLEKSTEQILDTFLLFTFWLGFVGAYLLAIFGMKKIVFIKQSLIEISALFALSLLPIAMVYNIAHYFTLLLIQGQAIISLISDPFNMGWNLFGTADYKINTGIIGAKAVWNTQVALIVFGHVVGVLVAHIISLRVFASEKKAVISQIPMLVLMVIYTLFGLWILSQPFRLGE